MPTIIKHDPAAFYPKATRALRPSRTVAARLQAIHAAADADYRRNAATVRAELQAGADARALYETAEPRSTRKRVLLGVLRRGLSALD